MTVLSEIALESLEVVVGGDWVTRAVDAAGPVIGKLYGEDWKTAPCITRANLGAEAVGLASTFLTTAAGYFGAKQAGGAISPGVGTALGVLGGTAVNSMLSERVRARYMRTCGIK